MMKVCAVLMTAVILVSAVPVRAADHLVAPGTVSASMAQAAAERAQHLATLDELLASPRAARAAELAGADVGNVRGALASLSNDEARDLAARAQALQSDPVAGLHEVEDVLGIALLVVLIIFIVDRID